MREQERTGYAVVAGDRLVARGELPAVVRAAYERAEDQPLILSDASGKAVDVDLRGPLSDVLARIETDVTRPRRGRPKLGVVPREVTLLPRHWDWLAAQPGGASAALRRLVDQARRETAGEDERRQAQEAAYRAATTLAGDRPGYEEAIRALFAGDIPAFRQLIAGWPPDIAAYVGELAARSGDPP